MDTLIFMERVGGRWNHADLSDTVVTIVDNCHYINNHPTLGYPFVWISTMDNTIRFNWRIWEVWFTRLFIDWRQIILERKLQTLAAICAQ